MEVSVKATLCSTAFQGSPSVLECSARPLNLGAQHCMLPAPYLCGCHQHHHTCFFIPQELSPVSSAPHFASLCGHVFIPLDSMLLPPRGLSLPSQSYCVTATAVPSIPGIRTPFSLAWNQFLSQVTAFLFLSFK